uniref:Bromo domain-containing protein n=1 Tax=Panagrellus redivivus TaxID=6233 RepID=A0A7E4UPN0_PANRE
MSGQSSASDASPGRRLRKAKATPARKVDSDFEDVLMEEASPQDARTGGSDSEAAATPTRKRRGRPPDPNSTRAIKRRAMAERRAAREQAAQKEREEAEENAAAESEEEVEEEVEPETADSDEKDTTPEMEVRDFSPFQLFCDMLLRKMMAKDPEEYFTDPVSPTIAPDYYKIIEHPMDFTTMLKKIRLNQYEDIDSIRHDVKLISENAMEYNGPFSIYYLAAQKLQQVAQYYLSEDYIEYLRYATPFGREVDRTQLNLPEKDLPQRAQRVPTVQRPEWQKVKWNTPTAKKLLADAPKAIRTKLTTEVPKWSMGILQPGEDGAVQLNILNGTGSAPVTIGDSVGKLADGHPGLFSTYEEAFPTLVPSSFLNYEPFASFAPLYDSTWATMNKRDSDLLAQTYGDRENAASVMQLREMVVDSGGYFLQVVDDMLDVLTDGEHSIAMNTLRQPEEDYIKTVEEREKRPSSPNSFRQLLDHVATLSNLGIDTTFVDEIKAEANLAVKSEAKSPAEAIAQNNIMLNDLNSLQQKRLARPVTNLANVPAPSEAETTLVAKIENNFVDQITTYSIPPNAVVTTDAVHDAMGVNEDECDFDLLREFMDI